MSTRAEQALLAYDYEFNSATNFYTKGTKEAWQPAPDGGFYCYKTATPTFSAPGVADPTGGKPFGKAVPEVPGWVMVPRTMHADWKDVSGVHPEKHEMAFEWVWSDDDVAEIYEVALAARENEGGENPFVRQPDGTLTRVG